ALRLDAAEREHEAAGGIAPVGAERRRARDIEGRNDLAARPDSDAVAGTDPDQRVVDEGQPVAKRHAEMVEKLERRRPGATLLAVDDDEVWVVLGFEHGLADGKEFPGVADAQLEPGRLATGPAPQLGNEADELERSGERRVARRRDAILSHRDPAGPCDLGAHLRGRQHAAMTRLGALAQFHLDHLDLVAGGGLGKGVGAEHPVAVAASEIARPDLPDDIAAHLAVIRTEPALARVMGEAALAGSAVEGADRVGAERAEAHRRDVEHRRRIGFRAIGSADYDTERLGRRTLRRDRVMQPLRAVRVDIVLGAERSLVEHVLGALIDDRTLVAAERLALFLVLEEILAHLGPDVLEQKTQMRRDRIVAQHRMPRLDEVDRAEDREA